MTKPLNVSGEDRSFGDRGALSVDEPVVARGRRDVLTRARPGPPGDADFAPGAQGRYGDLQQNLTARRRVMER